ncbi:bile acid:sodium symporter family protein [Cohaesibacter gelatinilyticus]|uniref:Bile acid:Na+ symporter, BASS family n=1 Tax=Cohaesibacter gelatinilyticus TaxID=372072 RepID=A0A285NHN2_9HYPH|nr:bile acid:sodium symporter family protein [Cohaesibacter gelatinilyticus]SNZ07171.1 bile acid:Na+ symporter, BASS family [Cohaesibacter gelatinilyticus]
MNTPLIPLGLAIIMITVGLSVQMQDFRALRKHMSAVSAGLIAQVLILPMLALSIGLVLKLDPVYAIGLVVLAAAPGGITSNFLSVLARGKVALSVSLTVLTNMLAFVTIPVVLSITLLAIAEPSLGEQSTQSLFALPFGRMVIGVLVISALPLALGMTIRHFFPDFSGRIVRQARFVASAIFGAIVVTSFVTEWGSISSHWSVVGPAVILLNCLSIGSALIMSRFFSLTASEAITIAVECGLQNVALALVICQLLLGNSALMVPASIYALVMNISILGLIYIGQSLIKPGTARPVDTL